ncbi:hypothetical protein PISMIDRAFT_17993 [Pisolithus microcarpus 441]|uniref:Uncharacterized protein n=1 Tax=Pisolithus microcarpus 441 TaxID=765257 RepID=A0A0C9XM50_9AGAM|nr:hypothetical protein PISMIDRAFT_17993 [Pisolithus microcarpus 441]
MEHLQSHLDKERSVQIGHRHHCPLPLSAQPINNVMIWNKEPELDLLYPRITFQLPYQTPPFCKLGTPEPDLPSELGSALGDQDVEIPEPRYEEEVERFASDFNAMASVEGQSSAVPAPKPNPRQSEQPSAPAPHPTVGLQQQLTREQADYWHHFYHPEDDRW